MSPKPPVSPPCAVHDGRAGNVRQALALARALADGAADCTLAPRAPWRWLAPRRLPGAGSGFGPAFAALLAAPPALAIGCGRQAALATRLLRARGSRVVQVLDPRLDPRHWDLVVAPAHDGLEGANVLRTLGSLNPVDDLWLAQARQAAPRLAALPAPHILLLVGAPTRHALLGEDEFGAMLHDLARRAREEGGSFSALASRRTPPAWRERLAGVAADIPGIRWRDTRDGDNPYAGLLAHADRIVCTPDSVNMLSEAAATLAPVFAWAPERTRGRLRIFLDALRGSGRVRALDGGLAPYPFEPLRETARIAALVRAALDLPGA